MDAVDFASGSRKMHIRNEDVGLGKDIISNLPDEILHQIVSFLPTKDLVRTSVLSTRWRKVWTYFHVIDIDLDSLDDNRELKAGFLVLVEKAMLFPPSARIRKFRLRLSAPIADASDVMAWMDKVMEHKVQELDLTLPEGMFCRLPDQLFSSNSLTKLKLEMDCELTIPDSVCFPRLKMLHLSGFKFSSVRSTEKLFSSCPVLEDLSLIVFNWGRIGSIVIYMLSLRTLSIGYYPMKDLPVTKITVSAPNLVSFRCVSLEPMDLVLCNQSSLEEATIDVLYEEFYNPESSLQRIVKLLHGIQAVKSLTLLSCTLKALSFYKDLHAILPSFNHMKHFHVVCPSSECCSRALIAILRKTPHLHSIGVESVCF